MCAHQKNCQKALLLRDLHNLLNQDEFNSLTEKAINAFINSCGQKYKYCPTPDCPSIFKVVDPKDGEGKVFCCNICFKRICTRCQVDMHDGISCDYYDKHLDPDKTMLLWMQKVKDAKHCPTCNQVIQKIDGCNNIKCRCGTFICWVCTAGFKAIEECYNHLRQLHGSVG